MAAARIILAFWHEAYSIRARTDRRRRKRSWYSTEILPCGAHMC
ncbi:hypothetical protein BS78_03G032500 [Paspalum vaginatum]|nr:hypothetical protein BS78_03G032500 [Paspalum vaginatum]